MPIPQPPSTDAAVAVQPAAAPTAAPAPAAAPEPFLVGVPRTAREVEALRARRSELSNQLESAASRRGSLAARLRQSNVSGADRVGLEQRLQVLDQRIVQLENDMSVTGRQLTSADPILLTSTSALQRGRGMPMRGQAAGVSFFGFIILAPLAFAAARLMWRRAGRPVAPVSDRANDQRMERLETAIDAIAIEVERIAEGQRFVTRLLSESGAAMPTFARVPEPAISSTPSPSSAFDARRPAS